MKNFLFYKWGVMEAEIKKIFKQNSIELLDFN